MDNKPLDDRDEFSWDDVHLAQQEQFEQQEAVWLQNSETEVW